MSKTEELYDLLTDAHFKLIAAYDLVPRWLNDDSVEVSPSELNALRKITTENALIANDLEGDIDALLDDVKPDPVETALLQVRDAIQLLAEKYDEASCNSATASIRNTSLDQYFATKQALRLVDVVLSKHGFEVPAAFRPIIGGELPTKATLETRGTVVDVREDRRQTSPPASVNLGLARNESQDSLGRKTSGTRNEQKTSREPTSTKTCSFCDQPMRDHCTTCFMLGL